MDSLRKPMLHMVLVVSLLGLPSSVFGAAPTNPPRAIAGKAVARPMAGGQVHLSWAEALSGGGSIDGYEILRGETVIADIDVADLSEHYDHSGAPNCYYIDTGTSDGSTYNYKILAYHTASPTRERGPSLDASVTVDVDAAAVNLYALADYHPGIIEFQSSGHNWLILSVTSQHTGTHSRFYCQTGATIPDLVGKRTRFDNNASTDIYSSDTAAFGAAPDADADGRIHLYFGTISSAGGYFWGVNERTPASFSTSNHREIIFNDQDGDLYIASSTMAHEFQHCIHNARDTYEDAWINEGCSVLAEDICSCFSFWDMRASETVQAFVANRGDEALWGNSDAFHYGACGIFMALYRQAIGAAAFKTFVDNDAHGTAAFGSSYEDRFSEWVLANILNNHTDFAGTAYDYREVNHAQLKTFEIAPALQTNPSWKREKDEAPTFASLTVGGTRAHYEKWRPGNATDPATLNILLRNGDNPSFARVVLDDGNGGDADEVRAKDNFSGGKATIKLTDLGVKFTDATLVLHNHLASEEICEKATFLTKRPKIQEVTFEQDGAATTSLSSGTFKVSIQFDQSMDDSTPPGKVELDPQGIGTGAGPIAIGGGAWSKKVYTADTWTGSGTIPDPIPANMLGAATLVCGQVKNFNEDPLDADPTANGDQPDTKHTVAIGKQKIDLILCIDNTGSMWDDIAAVKVAAQSIINAMLMEADARIALVTYKDFPVAPYGDPGDYTFRDVVGFTKSPTALTAGINGMSAWGGNDWAESVYSALVHCIGSTSLGGWREQPIKKAIIVMGDAPPHDPEPFTHYRLADVLQAAEDADPVIIFPVVVGGDVTALTYFTALAEGSGGKAFTAADASGVVTAILEAIALIKNAPLAEAGGPYEGSLNSPLTLDAGGSYDIDGTIVLYEWDWDNDGTYDYSTANPTCEHTWATPFDGMIFLRVTDNNGLTNVDTAHVTIHGNPPVAEAGGPYGGVVGKPVTLDASASSDSDGTIALYEWDWDNDGVYDYSTTDPICTHTWSAAYDGTVMLRVTDNDGLTSTDTAAVKIRLLLPPHAEAGGPYHGTVGQPIMFNAGGSYDMDGGVIETYMWDWWLDNRLDYRLDPRCEHTWHSAFSGKVRLYIYDDEYEVDWADADVVVTGPQTALRLVLQSHADLHLYDPRGTHVGINYQTGVLETQAPGSSFQVLDEQGNVMLMPWTGGTPGEGLRQVIDLPVYAGGKYCLKLVGTSDGPFELEVAGSQDGQLVAQKVYSGEILKGETIPLCLTARFTEGTLKVELPPLAYPPVMQVAPVETKLSVEPANSYTCAITIKEVRGVTPLQGVILECAEVKGPAQGIRPSDLTFDLNSFDVAAGGEQVVQAHISVPKAFAGKTTAVIVVKSANGGEKSVNIVLKTPGKLLPFASAGGPYRGVVGERVTFDAGRSYDPDGDIAFYGWDWNADDEIDEYAYTPTCTHTWSSAGTKTVRLFIYDEDNMINLDDTQVVVEPAPAP